MIHPPSPSKDLLQLSKLYAEVRSYTLFLTEPLSTEDHNAQPVLDVSPPKWHLGHTTWFFEEMILKPYAEDYIAFDERYSYYFNSYYESIGERVERHSRGALTRPPLEEVLQYRTYVDEHMKGLLQKELDPKITWLVELGLNHEQQHQELFLTDFKYILGVQAFSPVYREGFIEGQAEAEKDWVQFDEGIYEIGHAGSGFCFDNEKGRHKHYLQPFRIRQSLVSNQEWLNFMADGAYDNFTLWHAEAWDWVKKEGINAPLYWRAQEDGSWSQFTLGGLKPLVPEEPVGHISFYEAAAFCEWSNQRLPTEQEWEVASDLLSWGQRWEWTNSAYLPYPGYQKWVGPAAEYNGKFMVNQMVLRGASVATPKGHSRNTYRNFFHPHLRWQFTGLRPVARS